MKEIFIIHSKVFKYEGPAAWHFIELSREQSEELRKLSIFEVEKVGFGFIKVKAILNKTEWETTLFPQKNGPYLLSIKKSVREKEKILAGDTVTITCKLLLAS